MAGQDAVVAGPDRRRRDLLGGGAADDRAHLEVVGDEQAGEREFVANVGDKPRIDRTQRIAVEHRPAKMGGHHQFGAGGDPGPERNPVGVSHGLEVAVERVEFDMAVGADAAVAGKMLDAGGDAAGPEAAGHRGDPAGGLPGSAEKQRPRRAG